ncbi:Ferric siderophore transport system, biopolymer transport protein ExbB [hydrothermal vent metagenome]|uniref:Ferric siderophore transport system, biopolymer transport protein ExbB n=1 Tax=hydrothermal vent metagenome TaxID=652676 RepID=A0A3B1B5I9_9ZZZZ
MYEHLGGMLRFLETGGPVLWPIGVVAFAIGALVIERYWYFQLNFPHQMIHMVARWKHRTDHSSWYAVQVREAMIAEAKISLNQGMTLIRMLVALCPMLGLLGTVTGMMEVFDVMAVLGTGNARAMASGIYQAIIPTMAGMIVALPGLYFMVGLQRKVERRVEKLTHRLVLA